jgi:hypothetical protein
MASFPPGFLESRLLPGDIKLTFLHRDFLTPQAFPAVFFIFL